MRSKFNRRLRYNPETKQMEDVDEGPIERGGMILGDIEPFVSPVDGSIISSRSVLRHHMRQHGLAHTDDYTETWKRKRQERADYLAGKTNPDSKRRKAQMSDAFEHLRNQMRAKSRG